MIVIKQKQNLIGVLFKAFVDSVCGFSDNRQPTTYTQFSINLQQFADEEKTEKASPRKKHQAREKRTGISK